MKLSLNILCRIGLHPWEKWSEMSKQTMAFYNKESRAQVGEPWVEVFQTRT